VDPAPAEQGAWVENIPDLPGIRIKARGNNNGDYRALEAKLVREIPAPNVLRACLRKSRAASRAVPSRMMPVPRTLVTVTMPAATASSAVPAPFSADTANSLTTPRKAGEVVAYRHGLRELRWDQIDFERTCRP
jgi:hypothetical protein